MDEASRLGHGDARDYLQNPPHPFLVWVAFSGHLASIAQRLNSNWGYFESWPNRGNPKIEIIKKNTSDQWIV